MTNDRYRILVVSNISGMGKGGVPVFNQHLTEALARHHDVTLFTADPDTVAHQGARMVSTPHPPEGVDARDWITQQAGVDPRAHGLPDPQDRPFDMIIGHSRFSGPAATEIRDRWYPDARVAHFLHTSPERLPGFKYPDDPERAQAKAARDSSIEREVMGRADVVVGVGPLLTTEAERLSAAGRHVPDAHQLIPGVKVEELVRRGQHEGRLNLLVMGRTDDPLKGVDDALRAVKKLNAAGVDVHLTVRGADPEKLDRITKAASRLGGEGNVTVKPFTKDANELKNDIIGADAVIMPSKHEGFGLVATEAAGHGVPVLVNQDSGAAQFLSDPSRIDPKIGLPCVVPEPDNPKHRPAAWGKAMQELKADLPQRRENAKELREALKAYSWDHASQGLVEATMKSTPLPQKGQDGPAAQQQAQQRVTSVQGPNGTLLTSGEPKQRAAPAAVGPQSALARAANLTSPGARPAAAQANAPGAGRQGPGPAAAARRFQPPPTQPGPGRSPGR
ncbi:glycosyltransferase family 4 protein [Streptomyces sp. NPDC053048]|uniref:glycosyltransferase family 4 protein n=1 Tax=Streptomyces sp. NPDC053048 TaxID=3365694 RepID=UPI0037D131F4